MMQLGGELTDLPPVLDYVSELARLLLTMGVVAAIATGVVWLDRIADEMAAKDDELLDLEEQLDRALSPRCEICQQAGETLIPVKLFRGSALCCNACTWLLHEGHRRAAA